MEILNQKIARQSTFVGSVGFQSPEMIDEFQVSLASDLWALGIIIFKMSTGRLPFKSTHAKNIFAEIMAHRFDWPTDEPLDDDCQNLVKDLLQEEPERRIGCPETARDFTFL